MFNPKKRKMNISNLINETSANVTLNVTAEQLKEFALYVVKEYREAALAEEKTKEEVRLSQDEVCAYLHKTKATIWRWNKNGYLKPDGYLGTQPYYFRSTLDNLGRKEAAL